MWSGEPPPLPDWIEDAFEIIASEAGKQDGALTRAQAKRVLLDDATFDATAADADYALDRLLESGLLYAVDDTLRITDPGA